MIRMIYLQESKLIIPIMQMDIAVPYAEEVRKSRNCFGEHWSFRGFQFRTNFHLLSDLICASEHVIDASEVVCAREESIGGASRLIAFLQVSLFAEIAHLVLDQHVTNYSAVIESSRHHKPLVQQRVLTQVSYAS
jgi:hypothetical protein